MEDTARAAGGKTALREGEGYVQGGQHITSNEGDVRGDIAQGCALNNGNREHNRPIARTGDAREHKEQAEEDGGGVARRAAERGSEESRGQGRRLRQERQEGKGRGRKRKGTRRKKGWRAQGAH